MTVVLKDLTIEAVVAAIYREHTANKYSPDRDKLVEIIRPIFDTMERLIADHRALDIRFANLMSEHSKATAQAHAFKYALDLVCGRNPTTKTDDPSLLVERAPLPGCGCSQGDCCTSSK